MRLPWIESRGLPPPPRRTREKANGWGTGLWGKASAGSSLNVTSLQRVGLLRVVRAWRIRTPGSRHNLYACRRREGRSERRLATLAIRGLQESLKCRPGCGQNDVKVGKTAAADLYECAFPPGWQETGVRLWCDSSGADEAKLDYRTKAASWRPLTRAGLVGELAGDSRR